MKEISKFKADFLAYSGGFEPHEASDEVDFYVSDRADAYGLSEDEMRQHFDDWTEECEARERAKRNAKAVGKPSGEEAARRHGTHVEYLAFRDGIAFEKRSRIRGPEEDDRRM